MGIVKDLTPRRIMSFLASIIMMGSSLPGLAENIDAEIGTATGIVATYKGEPNDVSPVEEHISAVETEKEIKKLEQFSPDEFSDLADISEKDLNEILKAYSMGKADLTDLQLFFNFMRCKEVINQMGKEAFFNRLASICSLADHALNNYIAKAARKPNIAKTFQNFLLSEEDRKEYGEIFAKAISIMVAMDSKKVTMQTVEDAEAVAKVLSCGIDKFDSIEDISEEELESFESEVLIPLSLLFSGNLCSTISYYVSTKPKERDKYIDKNKSADNAYVLIEENLDPNNPVSRLVSLHCYLTENEKKLTAVFMRIMEKYIKEDTKKALMQ